MIFSRKNDTPECNYQPCSYAISFKGIKAPEAIRFGFALSNLRAARFEASGYENPISA